MIPKTVEAEWNITYRCDLSCTHCSHLCQFGPVEADMTLDDAREFCRQAEKLNWRPRIALIGGEPTLHEEMLGFVEIAERFCGQRIIVASNGYGPRAKALLAKLAGRADSPADGFKPLGSVIHPCDDIFIAPVDRGEGRRPCVWHTAVGTCGISVDHGGYSVCPLGGVIDGALGLGLRSKRLADLFDPDFARRQTEGLCRYCGHDLGTEFADCAMVGRTPMSKTWAAAVTALARKSGGAA